MRYAILLHRRTDGSYQASVPLLPGLTRAAESRDEALQLVQQALAETLATTEVVYLEMQTMAVNGANPWLETAGIFADDATLEDMLVAIYTERDAE